MRDKLKIIMLYKKIVSRYLGLELAFSKKHYYLKD